MRSQAGAAGVGAAGGKGETVGEARGEVGLVGTAVFTPTSDGVSLLVVLDGCEDGAFYPVRIHAGTSCAGRSGIGELWDGTRGDDIPDLQCMGAHASQEYVRSQAASKAWSVGGSSESDVIGHVLVIDDPEDRTAPLACGVITAP